MDETYIRNRLTVLLADELPKTLITKEACSCNRDKKDWISLSFHDTLLDRVKGEAVENTLKMTGKNSYYGIALVRSGSLELEQDMKVIAKLIAKQISDDWGNSTDAMLYSPISVYTHPVMGLANVSFYYTFIGINDI